MFGRQAFLFVPDKGYDSDAFAETITAQGSLVVIPHRSNRLNPRSYDRHIYKNRNLIERFFCRIRQFRRIATRYDKLAKSFSSFVHLACAFVWLTQLRTHPSKLAARGVTRFHLSEQHCLLSRQRTIPLESC